MVNLAVLIVVLSSYSQDAERVSFAETFIDVSTLCGRIGKVEGKRCLPDEDIRSRKVAIFCADRNKREVLSALCSVMKFELIDVGNALRLKLKADSKKQELAYLRALSRSRLEQFKKLMDEWAPMAMLPRGLYESEAVQLERAAATNADSNINERLELLRQRDFFPFGAAFKGSNSVVAAALANGKLVAASTFPELTTYVLPASTVPDVALEIPTSLEGSLVRRKATGAVGLLRYSPTENILEHRLLLTGYGSAGVQLRYASLPISEKWVASDLLQSYEQWSQGGEADFENASLKEVPEAPLSNYQRVYTASDHLQGFFKSTGIPTIGEAVRAPDPLQTAVGGRLVSEWIKRFLAREKHSCSYVKLEKGWLLYRNRSVITLGPTEPSEELLHGRLWQSGLTIDAYASFVHSLSDEQRARVTESKYFVAPFPLSPMAGCGGVLPLWHKLSVDQKEEALSDSGLAYDSLADVQREAYERATRSLLWVSTPHERFLRIFLGGPQLLGSSRLFVRVQTDGDMSAGMDERFALGDPEFKRTKARRIIHFRFGFGLSSSDSIGIPFNEPQQVPVGITQ